MIENGQASLSKIQSKDDELREQISHLRSENALNNELKIKNEKLLSLLTKKLEETDKDKNVFAVLLSEIRSKTLQYETVKQEMKKLMEEQELAYFQNQFQIEELKKLLNFGSQSGPDMTSPLSESQVIAQVMGYQPDQNSQRQGP